MIKLLQGDNPFEEYLKDVHAKDYYGTDDDMPYGFKIFMENLEQDMLIHYANKFALMAASEQLTADKEMVLSTFKK